MRLFLLTVSMVTFAAGARAGDCDNAMDQNTMNACAEDAYRKSDAELNAVYKQLQSRSKGEPQTNKLLSAAERAWLAFRDAECTYSAAGNEGGSLYPSIYFGCLGQLTKTRTAELNRYLQCPEGDVACSAPPAGK
jgi:uncharacterized protein YecT (DUF1311 family)